MTNAAQNFEILDGYAADVLAVSAHGTLTRQDYETVLIPKFEEMVRQEGKVKLLCVFGDDFSGYSAGAAWDDTKFGFLHMREMAGVAVVTDNVWLRLGVKTFAPLISCPVALFHMNELEDAQKWISEWEHEPENGPGVSVEHKLPTLEDKA
ncbi:STAS/SEC14 domain-containing protein [Roseovarius sp.]|uniref:STAS/SEC14 domain-containing protein n=1 Tax=Roseovarius sp. TaxID=1486281 RepID=UPI0026306FC7|nr:STAS/SEC14 domain-containing protein [Roseovarius sp.]